MDSNKGGLSVASKGAKGLPLPLPAAEYAGRRQRLLKALGNSAAVVFAGDGAPPQLGRWRPHAHFLYLTGLDNESGAAVLFDPTAEDPKRRICLFLRPIDPEMDRWDGYRDELGEALKQRTGFEAVFRTNLLPRFLTAAARRGKKLACLHPFAVSPAAVTPDLAAYRQVSERIPGVGIEDRTQLLSEMRAIKSKGELGLMRRAVDATAAGYREAMSAIRPGSTEAEVARVLESGYRAAGGTGLAYNPIVGSGVNSTVLHYNDNNRPLEAGELLLIDSAASVHSYAADVTRTYPVSGKFTDAQRDVYEVVLKAMEAAIRVAKAGTRMSDVDAAARNVIERAGLGDAFNHGIGHPLGLEVHDITPDGPLRNGMVVTIEPGIYLPDLKIGIRLEDDIYITGRKNENLTGHIPKKVADVEAALRR